jgi:hypothetical protein
VSIAAQATPVPAPVHGAPGSTPAKSALRYNGQSFDEWRSRWQTELSSEKRAEAVRALAAFARAGYGKEATDAILDVAGQYDFNTMGGNTSDDKLKEAVMDELAPSVGNPPLAVLWLPEIIARSDKDPATWKWLAINLIDRFRTDQGNLLDTLRSLVASDKSALRGAAIRSLFQSGKADNDNDRKLLDETLKSSDAEAVRAALDVLSYRYVSPGQGGAPAQLRFVPTNITAALLNPDQAVRRFARGLVTSLDEKDRDRITKELLATLHDESRTRVHIEAIRALAALNENNPRQDEAVVTILKTELASNDRPTSVAAAMALKKIFGKDQYQKPLADVLGKQLNIEVVKTPNGIWGAVPRDANFGAEAFTKFNDDVIREQEALFPSQNENRAGGGFF